MDELRLQTMRLAYKNPSLRSRLIPLLKAAAEESLVDAPDTVSAGIERQVRSKLGPQALGLINLYQQVRLMHDGAPGPDEGLAQAFRTETKLFARSMMRKLDGPVAAPAAETLLNQIQSLKPLLQKVERGSSTAVYRFLGPRLAQAIAGALQASDIGVALRPSPDQVKWPILKITSAPDPIGEKTYFTEEEIDRLPEAGAVNQPGSKDKFALKAQADEAHEQQLDWLNRGRGIDAAIGAQVLRGDQGAIPADDKVDRTPDGRFQTKDKDGRPRTFNSKEEADFFAEGVGNEKRAEYFSNLPEGPIVLIGPKKAITGRAQEKVDAKYGGDWSKLKDFVRASIIVDRIDQLDDLMKKLRASGLKLAAKPDDRFSKPTEAGYRDLSMNVVYPNGHVGELQIHLKPMIQAKEGFGGHKLYEKTRKFSTQAKKEGRSTVTLQEQILINDLNDKQKQLYGAAWREIQGEKGALRNYVESGGMGKLSFASQTVQNKVQYFRYDGEAAYWERGKFPIVITDRGEQVEYNLKKFFTKAISLTKDEYAKLRKSRNASSSGDSDMTLRSKLIRLAHENPSLRGEILPLLKSAASGLSPEEFRNAWTALEKLADEARLPNQVKRRLDSFLHGNPQIVELPDGLDSLLKYLRIEVSWSSQWDHAVLSWVWTTPDNKPNTRVIGEIGNPSPGQWYWKVASGGGSRYV